MHRKTAFPILAALAILLVAGTAQAGSYQVDVSHSQVLFKVKHFGISTVTGQFKEFSASFDVDPSDLSTLSARAEVQASSVDTREEDRDKHLRSDDFLGVQQHPEITFASTKAEVVGSDEVKLHGNLTIRGVTKPVVLDTKFGGAVQDPWGNARAAFTATVTINRKDFNVSWNQLLDNGGLVVSDEVMIVLEIEGIDKAETD